MAKRKPKKKTAISPDESMVSGIVKSLNKNIKGGVACILSKDKRHANIKTISTGSTLLDFIISNRYPGGIPMGRVSLFYGDPSTGKSLICAHVLKNVQSLGGLAVFINSEMTIDISFLKRVGLNIDDLVYVQPDTVEEVFAVMEDIINTVIMKGEQSKPAVIVFDSLASAPTSDEIEAEGDYNPQSQIAWKARVVSKAMRKLIERIDKSNIGILITNQVRTNIKANPFMDPDTMPGGRAVSFHSDVVVKLTAGSKIKDTNSNIIGVRSHAKVIKDRIAPPLRKCASSIFFSHGIDDEVSIYEYLVSAGAIKKNHGFRSVEDARGEEVTFRESDWKNMMTDDKFKQHILKILKDQLIIKYDG